MNYFGSSTPPYCNIEVVDVPAAQLTKGVSAVLHTLLNAVFSGVLKTKIFLGGLNIDFYKVGVGNPTEAGSPTISQLDSDCGVPTDYGCGNPDYFAIAGEFVGTIDFAKLLALFGGISLSPGFPVEAETYISFGDVGVAGFPYKGFRSGRVHLTPSQSFALGFSTEGGVPIFLKGVLTGVPEDAVLEEMRFSWRVDGGEWKPYRKGDILLTPPLLSGRHVLEVKGKGPLDIGDMTPVEVVFYVDDVPPDLLVYDEGGRYIGGNRGYEELRGLVVRGEDNLTSEDRLFMRYRVDGGRWEEVRRGRVDLEGYRDGRVHEVEVEVVDEFQNRAKKVVRFVVPEVGKGFGCGVLVGGGRGFEGVLFFGILLLLWIALRRRGEGWERKFLFRRSF
jgi:hypothetical protein